MVVARRVFHDVPDGVVDHTRSTVASSSSLLVRDRHPFSHLGSRRKDRCPPGRVVGGSVGTVKIKIKPEELIRTG